MVKISKSKKIVWSLFDSETAAAAKALPDHDVFCFGVGSGSGHIHLDLGCFETARKELDKYPRPDYLFASPPCETWCFVSVGSKRFFTSEPGINLYWRSKFVPFDFLPVHYDRRMNGVRTAETLARLINFYSPVYWSIENPCRSLLFDYLRDVCGLPGFRNLTNYYSYGFGYLKPTIIYSNAHLILRNSSPRVGLSKIEDRIKNFDRFALSSYRSRVPLPLYLDIFSQFSGGFLL